MKTGNASLLLRWALLSLPFMLVENAFGFIPPSYLPGGSRMIGYEQTIPKTPFVSHSFVASSEMKYPTSVRRQRYSIARVQTMGLFGLGLPEIAIILAVAAFLLGPEKLGNFAGQVKGAADGGIPEEYKKIPEAFKEGVDEGESNVRARKAKPMEPVEDCDRQD